MIWMSHFPQWMNNMLVFVFVVIVSIAAAHYAAACVITEFRRAALCNATLANDSIECIGFTLLSTCFPSVAVLCVIEWFALHNAK
jgi:hypothetical protein